MDRKPGTVGIGKICTLNKGTLALTNTPRPGRTNRGRFSKQRESTSVSLNQMSQPLSGPGPKIAQIYFATNDRSLDANDRQVLNKLSHQLMGLKRDGFSLKLAIVGHTDSRGSAVYNAQLAQTRANAVAQYLGCQVNVKTVQALSMGEQNSIQPKGRIRVTQQQLSQDRRVDVYLDQNKRTIILPPTIIKASAPTSKLDSLWAGIAVAHSGDLILVGKHNLIGKIYNLGGRSPIKNTGINIHGWKFGAGLGASGGLVFVIAHGYKTAGEMKGVSGGWDFDFALVAKLADFIKGVKGLGKAIDSIEKYEKMRYLTENAIKNMGITKPGVYSIPIPFAGGGAHVWGGYKFGDVDIFSPSTGVP